MTDNNAKIQSLMEARARILDDYKNKEVQTVVGNYDADSNLLSDGSTNRLQTDSYNMVQAPELKNSDGTLNPLGIQARVQADNYAMGITNAQNMSKEQAEYLASNPEVFSKYTEAMNPSIANVVQEGSYIPTDTGRTDVYKRPLTNMQNSKSEMDQGEFLVNTGNAYGTLRSPLDQVKFDSIGIKGVAAKDLDRRHNSNLVDSAQSAVVNISGNLTSLLGKTLSGYGNADNADINQETKEDIFRGKSEPLIDMGKYIDTGRKLLNDKLIVLGDKLDKTGSNMAKHSDELTGAWNTSSDMIGTVWDELKEGNYGKALDKVSVYGIADTIVRSLPDMVISGVALPVSMATNINRVLDDYYETNKTDTISAGRLTGVVLAGMTISMLDRLGFETIIGKGALAQGIKENVAQVVNRLGKGMPSAVVNNAINTTLQFTGRVALTGAVEAGTEVAQEGTQIAAVELGYDPKRNIFRQENIDKIGQSALGGLLGGAPMKAGSELTKKALDITKSTTDSVVKQKEEKVKKQEEIDAKIAEVNKPYTDSFSNIKTKYESQDLDIVSSINELINLSSDLEIDENKELQAEVNKYRNTLIAKLSEEVQPEDKLTFGSSEEALVAMNEIYSNTKNKESEVLNQNLNTIATKYKLENELLKIKDRGQVEEEITTSEIGYVTYGNQLKRLMKDPDNNSEKITKYVNKLENLQNTQEVKLGRISKILEQAKVQFENTDNSKLSFPEYQVRVNPITGKGKPLEINRQDYINFKEGKLTGYFAIAEDTKKNISEISKQLDIPGLKDRVTKLEREVDDEIVIPLTSNPKVNSYRNRTQVRFNNNKVNKLISLGEKQTKEYAEINPDISNTGSYKATDTVGLILDNSVISNLVYYKKNKIALSKNNYIKETGNELLKAIKAQATVITDIKSQRTSKEGRDLLAKFMIDAGYKESKIGNGIWKPADQFVAEVKEEKENKPKPKEEPKEEEEIIIEQVQDSVTTEVKDITAEIALIKKEMLKPYDQTDNKIRLDEMQKSLDSLLSKKKIDNIFENTGSKDVKVTASKKLNILQEYSADINTILNKGKATILGSLSISNLSPEVQKYTKDLTKSMTKILPAVNNTVSKYGGKTYEYLNIRQSPARALVFDKDGNINQNVVLAIGSSIEDLIKNSGSLLSKKNQEEVMRMLDKIYITKEEYDFFKDKGMFLKVVADDLSKNIIKQLGLTFNKDIPAELEAKFKADLGNIAIRLAEELGMVEVNQVSLSELAAKLGKQNEYGVYRDDVDAANIQVSFVSLGSKEQTMFDTLQDELLLDTDYGRYPSASPVTKSKHIGIKNNPYNTIAEKVQKALTKQRTTKYIAKTKSIEWLKDNRDIALVWLGYKTQEDIKELSKVDQETAIAKNESIVRSLDALKENQLNEMYFDFFYTKNNRYILDSTTVNPQTDKQLHRWLIVPEGHNNTYNKSESKAINSIAIALAQAFGTSIDKKNTTAIVEHGIELLNMSKKDLNLLKAGLKLGDLTQFTASTGLEVEVEHLGHFLEGIATIEEYQKTGDTFTTSISVEFDGLTNGFAIRLMQMPFVKDINNWLEKVGVFKNSEDSTTMNNILSDKTNRFLDSYQTLADKIVKSKASEVKTEIGKYNKLSDKEIMGILNVLPIKDVNGVITKELRDLFKNPFMVFNYASSINSIKKSMGYVLRDKILKEIAEGKHLELVNTLGISKKDIQTKYPEVIKLKNGVMLDKALRDVIEASYGKQVGDILTDFFGEYIEANTTINNSFRGMFLVFKDAYTKATEGKALTEQQKIDEVVKLIDLFPGVKGVLSKDIREGIAIYETKPMSPKDLQFGKAQTKLIDKEGKEISKAVQGLLKELDSPVNAGAVLPIHSLDGSIMTELMLAYDNIVGIHDAIIPNLLEMDNTIKKYNEEFYNLNKNYSILESLLEQVTKSLEYATANKIDPIINAENEKAAINLSEVHKQLIALNTKNNEARDTLYSSNLSIGQMVGVNNESLFKTSEVMELSNKQMEDEVNLFGSKGEFIFSSADISMEDTKLMNMVQLGKTPKEILEYLTTSDEAFVAQQAKELLNASELYRNKDWSDVIIDPVPTNKEGALASYNTRTETLSFSSLTAMSHPLIFLHEYTHGLSSHGIDFMDYTIENEPDSNKAVMFKNILKDVDLVLDHKDKFEDIYAFKDRHEVFAEFMSNPVFRERLKELPVVKDKDIYQKLVAVVKELFGFKGDRLFDLLNRSKDDFFRVNFEVLNTDPELKDIVNLLLTKPEGYRILDKIISKMKEC